MQYSFFAALVGQNLHVLISLLLLVSGHVNGVEFLDICSRVHYHIVDSICLLDL